MGASLRDKEPHMDELMQDYEEPDTLDWDDEAEDWDEETLGLDWNEADAQSLVREVIPSRGLGE
jgi:hypothetical protein